MSLNQLKFIAQLGIVAVVFSASSARAAMTTLKQVQVSNGSQIDLLFDGKVGKSQARAEFFNDVIQISLNDVSVYPAKISSINGGPLVKIFAYQYAPKLVRCRLTVSGKAEDFKDRLQITSNGKVLSLKLVGNIAKSDEITTQAAHPAKVAAKESEKASEATKGAARNDAQPREIEAVKADAGQAALLERVMKSSPSKPVPVTVVDSKESKSASASERSRERNRDRDDDDSNAGKKRKSSLSGAAPLPSPMGVLAKLLGVIALFGAMALVAKKFVHGRNGGNDRQLNARLARSVAGESGGWMSALGGIARNAAAGLGRKDKMIEVLSNHHLGPKKSIAVVRVMGRTLVLGVTNDAINLISQISENQAADGSDDESSVDLEGLFADAAVSAAMGRPRAEPAATKPVRTQMAAPQSSPSRPLPGMDPSSFSAMVNQEVKKPAAPNVRSQIRSRLEGLKQL
jgi:flagellar biogenesis protein FliO